MLTMRGFCLEELDWLKNYCLKSQTNGFVVGASGGVDSAVTSTLCAKTGLPVLCLDLPIYQSKDEQSRALNHLKWLKERFPNVSFKSIDLSKTFSSFENSVELNSTNTPISEISIYDLSGKLLLSKKYNSEININLNISNLASGIYLLKINNKKSIKLIKN